MNSLAQLSQQLNEQFKSAFLSFVNYNFFVPEPKAIVAQVVFPYFTPFNKEPTVFGKLMRMAWYLEKKKDFLEVLAKHRITEVMYTEVQEGKPATKENTIIVTTKLIENVFAKLHYADMTKPPRLTGVLAEQYIDNVLGQIISAQ